MMLVTEVKRQLTVDRGKKPDRTIPKSKLRRSPSKTLHPVLTASQPHFPLCQFSN
ncbi:hypothetical protein [Microcoleus sp. Pol11C3]|uniref:hypothetical protein n=1 Tax=Microcoleus sp. Pol11C3 TaxID=3055390 RepID=UPI002FD17592